MRSVGLYSWIAVVAVTSVPLAGAACSSSSPGATTGGTSDAGGVTPSGDASSPASDDGGGGAGDDGAATLSATCGAAPYVSLGITVDGYGVDGGLPGVRFTSPLCPAAYDITDATGSFTGQVTKGATFYGRFDAANYVSLLTPEQRYAADDTGVVVDMFPTLFTALIAGYDATKGAIFVAALQDTGTGACSALDGVTFSILEQPTATATYYSTASIPSPVTGATATTASGRASFAGLPLGTPVTLVASKPGCDVTFVYGPNTGRAPLEAGYVTFIGAHVDDASDAGEADASDD